MRNADVAHRPARAGRLNSQRHRLRRAHTFEYRVGSDTFGEFFYPRYSLIPTLGHYIGGSELAGELLSRLVTADCDNPPGPHLPGGQNAEKAHRSVADYHRRA